MKPLFSLLDRLIARKNAHFILQPKILYSVVPGGGNFGGYFTCIHNINFNARNALVQFIHLESIFKILSGNFFILILSDYSLKLQNTT